MAKQVQSPGDGVKPVSIEPTDYEVANKEEGTAQENSVYEDVRAAVPAEDHDLPVNTIRVWVLGTLVTILMAAFTQLFNLHNPPITMSSYFMILAIFPIAKLVSRYTPKWTFNIMGYKLETNPGPFNYKEHTVIAIMAIGSVGYDSGALATYVWTAMIKRLDIPVSIGFKLLFQLSVQGLAFGLAGIFQKLLVDPAYCIWPTALPTCTVIHGMHNSGFATDIQSRWKIKPIKFFWIAIGLVTLWEFVPGYLWTGLSYFAWVTWIVPNNVLVNTLFGAWSGMDLLPITFDWNQIIAYQPSPLVTPAWAVLNVLAGSILFLWIVAPALHWSNIWYGKYFPFSSSTIFDNTGVRYNTSRILLPDHSLNSTAYHEYSPIYLSTTSAMSYGLGFGAVISVVVYAALYHHEEIWFGFKSTFIKTDKAALDEDIHVKLMKKYRATPTWWYAVALVVIAGFCIWFAESFGTQLPWWGVILAIGINLITFVPVALLTASCNQAVSTNVFSAFVGGYLWPGKMIAVVVFKCLTFNTLGSALVLAKDQKLGHYMKVPPRIVFTAQALGILINWIVQIGVNAWALDNIKGVCTREATGNFTCPVAGSFESSIIFWGTIGPHKLFSSGALYQPMLYFFLIGAVAPVVVWFLGKKFPRHWVRYVNIPLILASTSAIPPATAINFFAWAIVGIIFQWYLKTRAHGWWSKYNFLLSAALDGGLAFANFLMFFCLKYPGVELNWWGNNVESTTADYLMTPLMTVAKGQTFGPTTWL